MRPFLSLAIAGAATTAGAALALPAAVRHSNGVASLRPDPGADALFLVGVLLLAIATASLLVHWLGVFVVGGIHLVLGGLAVLVPTGGLLSGAYSPIFEIAMMLGGLNRQLGDGALLFSFSGAEFALGAFLVAAALAVRTRQDSEPARAATASTASIIGVVVLGGAIALLVTVGGDFTTRLFHHIEYDVLLAFGVALAAVLAGIAGLTLRWASTGVAFVALIVLVGGLIAFFAIQSMRSLPTWFLVSPPVTYGFSVVLAASMLTAAVVARFAPRSRVPVDVDAL